MEEDKLKLLGYAGEWITGGYLSEALFARQLAEYEPGATEHCRYQAFRDWIYSRASYTDAELDGLYRLIHLDPDPIMAYSAGLDLVRRPGLTDVQFDRFAAFLSQGTQEERVRKVIAVTRHLRVLQSLAVIGEEEFRAYLALDLSEVQEYLLEHFAPHNEAFMEMLAEKGTNKKIRNKAKQGLQHIRRQAGKGRT